MKFNDGWFNYKIKISFPRIIEGDENSKTQFKRIRALLSLQISRIILHSRIKCALSALMPSPRPSHAPSYVPLKGGNSRKIRDKIKLDGIQQENVRLHVLVQDKIGQDRTGQHGRTTKEQCIGRVLCTDWFRINAFLLDNISKRSCQNS
jgi:hypothetical protein